MTAVLLRGSDPNVTFADISTQFDGAAMLRALEAATARLEANVDEVNALNVYPVPDGDTGTNMLHTMRSALKEARAGERTLAAVGAAAAHGALMGARGNSGVILSQIVRGMKDAFAGKTNAGVPEMRRAAELARRYAYDAVSAPAPGTMLTLTVAMEDAAAFEGSDVVDMLRGMTAETERALARTREENPTNRAAGVVDAGARGLQLLLEGLLSSLSGKEVPLTRVPLATRSLGASVVRGGPTMNPSTEELVAAINAANARTVIVLPNDKNVILAAEQAAKVAKAAVRIVRTRNVAQGMAALVAFDPAKNPAEIADEMAEVAERAHGIEVTRAIRDATVDGERVRQGEAMALLDGRVVAHGEDEVTVLCEAARRLTDAEILTLYSGAGVDEVRVQHAVQRLRAACPRVSVEIAHGGQPHYPFIVAAE